MVEVLLFEEKLVLESELWNEVVVLHDSVEPRPFTDLLWFFLSRGSSSFTTVHIHDYITVILFFVIRILIFAFILIFFVIVCKDPA